MVCSDPNEDRCYAECTTAVLNIDVGCPSDHILEIEKLSDNGGCQVGLSSGSVETDVVVFESVVYEEGFVLSGDGAVLGSSVQSDGVVTEWEFREVVAPVLGVGGVGGVERYLEVPAGGEYEFDFNFYVADGVVCVRCRFYARCGVYGFYRCDC